MKTVPFVRRLSGLLFAIALLSATVAGAVPNGGGSIRWCLTDGNGNKLCCGPWVDWGTGLGDLSETQANNQAWSDFQNSGCPGVYPDGSSPPYILAGSGGGTIDSNLNIGNLGPSGQDGVDFTMAGTVRGWDLGWTPMSSSAAGAYLDVSAAALRGATPLSLGSARYSETAANAFTLDADLSTTGVPYQVRCFLGGAFVASGPFQSSGRVGDVLSGSWPRSSAIGTGTSPSVTFGWAAPISFKIRGDALATNCDSLAVVAWNANITSLTQVSLRLRNMDAFRLNRLDNSYAPLPIAAPLAGGPAVVLMMVGIAGIAARRLLRPVVSSSPRG